MGKKVTVGYWYGMGLHMGVCHGPVNEVIDISQDDRPILPAVITASGEQYIDRLDLFGGEKREGGLQGTLGVYFGDDNQTAAGTQMEMMPGGVNQPGYRGILSLFFYGLVSANNPYLKPFSAIVRRRTAGWDGGAWYPSRCAIGGDMNPAHIIYETHTNQRWGMGYPASSIDSANFTAVADKLYNEGFGLSLLWNQQTTFEDFHGIIMDHIGGVLRTNPRTGKFEIKLIRADYDPATLPLFDPSNSTMENFQRAAGTDTINELTVIYTNNFKDTPLTVHNLANIRTQGSVISKTVHYPGITNPTIAGRVGMRDLRSLSTPTAKIRLTTNRKGWDVLPGDCIRVTQPKHGLDQVVFRVLKVSLGDLRSGKIQIDATEDIFGLPSSTYVEQEEIGWVQPGSTPVAAPRRYVAEAPYWDLTREMTAAELATLTTTDCYLSVSSQRPSSDAYDPNLFTRISGGVYADMGSCSHCPVAVLDGAHPINATTLQLRDSVDLSQVNVGEYLYVGGELMRVDAVNTGTESVTVSPGVLDTVPRAHADGEVVFFVDGFQTSDEVQYATGETVQVRIQTQTTRGELDINTAPQDSVTMTGRQARPYPPGRLQINGATYPANVTGTALTIAWAHRNRLQQTAYIVPQTDGNIGPESGTTYNLRIYEGPSLLLSQTGLAGTSYSYSLRQTAALLHFDGANGATAFTDDTGKVWTPAGNAQISTAQSQFSGASGLFDGTGDMISTPASVDFYLQSNFTIEAWVRPAAFGNYNTIFGDWESSRSYPMLLGINSAGNLVTFLNASNRLTSTVALSLNTWAHVAWVRNGSTLTVYINGTARGSATYSAAIGAIAGNAGRIGAADAAAAHQFNGHIDELRVSNGVARYTGNFTVPGAPFVLENAGDLPTRTLRVELESVRDGLVSHNTHNYTFTVN